MRDIKITSKWGIESLKPSITVVGTVDNTTTTIKGDGGVTISLVDGFMGVTPDDAYQAIENMAQDVDTLLKVWEVENAIAADLMHMVDISPVGYEDSQWYPSCSEEGLSWCLDLRPRDHASLVITIYLHADLSADLTDTRTMPDVYRSISIEVRDNAGMLSTLYSTPVCKKGPITNDVVREYLHGDHLNIQLLCDYMGMKITPITNTN